MWDIINIAKNKKVILHSYRKEVFRKKKEKLLLVRRDIC
jgi:hypothetical protein